LQAWHGNGSRAWLDCHIVPGAGSLAHCAATFSRIDAVQEMILPLKRYAQFEGRANRREYWMYQLFLFLVATAVMLLAGVLAILLRNSPTRWPAS
jgi:hypothetical protein